MAHRTGGAALRRRVRFENEVRPTQRWRVGKAPVSKTRLQVRILGAPQRVQRSGRGYGDTRGRSREAKVLAGGPPGVPNRSTHEVRPCSRVCRDGARRRGLQRLEPVDNERWGISEPIKQGLRRIVLFLLITDEFWRQRPQLVPAKENPTSSSTSSSHRVCHGRTMRTNLSPPGVEGSASTRAAVGERLNSSPAATRT
jgi:hypothetical protein